MRLCSLLHITEAPAGTVGQKLLYHLSMDQAFLIICQNLPGDCRETLLNVLSEPLTREEDIAYRREILQDLTQCADLLDRMAQSLSEFKLCKKAFYDLKKEIQARNFGIRSTLGGSRESVRESAQLLLRMLDQVKQLGDILSLYTLSSRGLCTLAHELGFLTAHEAYAQLISTLREAESICLPTHHTVSLTLNASGRIAGCHLTEPFVNTFSPEVENPVKKRFWPGRPFSKPVEADDTKGTEQGICMAPPKISSDCQSRISAYPFLEMEALLTSLMAGIVNSMGSLYGEIGFYVAARAYVRFLHAKNVPYTWPDVGEQSAFQGMCDLCLLTGNTEHIAPNDYGASDKDGALLLGDNGNGKTVFLRSIMTCQLLAQGGLPIPASSGTVKLYTCLRSQFAESEEPHAAAEQMGRFEQEVRELHTILEEIPADSLLILNEVFQTTAYAEGAVGLYYILRYLTEKRVKWIAVTHLTDLRTLFREQGHGRVVMYEMSKEHRAFRLD